METSAQILLALGVLLLRGLFADEGSRRLGLPSVTVLLALGFAAGPGGFDLLPSITDTWFPVVSTIALTMVGFLLGSHFTADNLRTYGKSDLIVASVQALATAGLVIAGLSAIGVDTTTALALGGIAVATAPAATLAIVHEQRASGPFTRSLLTIVALDDVIALTLFSILVTVAGFLPANDGDSLLIDSLWEILGALLLGLVIGLPAAFLTGRLRPGLPTQEEAYGIVLVCAGLAVMLEVSFLLAAVVMGATIANRATHHELAFREIERIEWPALVVFFVLAGASLELSGLRAIGWIGVGYLLLRTAGKVLGCVLGGRLAGWPVDRQWLLGPAMLPQAGVAIGLSLLAAERFPAIAEDLLAVVIAATVVFELVGPIAAKAALQRVGEAGKAAPAATV